MSANPVVAPREVLVCDLEDLRDGQLQSVTVGRARLAAVMTGDEVKVFYAACPHHGGPLEMGNVVSKLVSDQPGEMTLVPESQVLRCPWHGIEFELDAGRAIADHEMCLRFVPNFLSDGKVWVHWPPGQPTAAE